MSWSIFIRLRMHSYLSAQTLKTISDSYDVEINAIWLMAPRKNSPEPDLLTASRI